MKFRLISDVHLDVTPVSTVLTYLPVYPEDKDTVLLLAGDIGGWPELSAHGYYIDLFFETISKQFKHVCYIMGNHEAYGGCLEDVTWDIEDYVKRYSNITLLNDQAIVFDDTVVIGSTLWSDFNNEDPLVMMESKRCMNDYRLITKRAPFEYLKPAHTLELHKLSVAYLEYNMLKYREAGNKLVIMTHHAPSFMSVDSAYTHSALNGAYASSLEHLMDRFEPLVWVHGHMHAAKDYEIYNTRVLCNPFGYSPRERLNFKLNCIFET